MLWCYIVPSGLSSTIFKNFSISFDGKLNEFNEFNDWFMRQSSIISDLLNSLLIVFGTDEIWLISSTTEAGSSAELNEELSRARLRATKALRGL